MGTLEGMSRRVFHALIAAAGCAGALVAAWVITFEVPVVRWLDSAALQGFVGLDRPVTTVPAEMIASLGDPLPFALLGAGLIAAALAQGRPRVAVAVPIVLLGASLTTQILKPLLADPRVCDCWADGRVAAASWPSGHATASMSLALCAVLVTPARWRPTAAMAGALLAIAVSYALLSLGWHYPSDVLAGYLVAALWMTLAVAGLWAAGDRWPARTGREAVVRWGASLGPVAAGVVLLVVGLAAITAARPEAALHYAQAHTTFVFVAAMIAATGAAVAGGFAAALRR